MRLASHKIRFMHMRRYLVGRARSYIEKIMRAVSRKKPNSNHRVTEDTEKTKKSKRFQVFGSFVLSVTLW